MEQAEQEKKYSGKRTVRGFTLRDLLLPVGVLLLPVLLYFLPSDVFGEYTGIISLLAQLSSLLGLFYVINRQLLRPLMHLAEQSERLVSEAQLTAFVTSSRFYAFKRINNAFNELQEDILNARKFINEIEQGHLEAEYPGLADGLSQRGGGIAADLISMRDRMQEMAKEEENRLWVNNGISHFVELLRNRSDNVQEIGNLLLSEVVRYVGALQGGLFLCKEAESGERVLELVASYAYDRRKFLDKQLELGEGLVGQVFLERKTTYLLEVPKGYFNIFSGTGEADPNCAIVVPLMQNEEVHGVIELAALQAFAPHQVEFVEKLGEYISATFSSIQVNERTRKLLEESQEQTEQLRAQEEEMRQNMEELQATQESQERLRRELQENEQVLKEKLAELEAARETSKEQVTNERKRFEHQLHARSEMMKKVQEKFKAREKELLEKIKKMEGQQNKNGNS